VKDADILTAIKAVEDSNKTVTAKLEEIPAVILQAFEADPDADPDKKKPEAELEEAGALAGITSMEVWDIPIGKAIIGGFVAVVGSELIDGFLAGRGEMVLGITKLVAAGAVVKWGSGLLSKNGATAVALLLAYDGIRHVLPIDQYAHRLASGVSGVVTTRGLGGNKGSDTGNGKAAPDYYEALKGGR